MASQTLLNDPAPGSKMWLPLESNPVVLESYLKALGAKEGTFAVADVYGLDDDLLAMVPPTAVAVLMLFPLTDKTEKAVLDRDLTLRSEAEKASGEPLPPGKAPFAIPKDLFFMSQYVGNACGTIGLLHALGNHMLATKSATVAAEGGAQPIGIEPGSFVDKFVSQAAGPLGMDPHAVGLHLQNSDLADALHSQAAVGGQSELPDDSKGAEDPHNRIYHFVAFVAKDGYLWELDGRRPYAHRSGPCPSGSTGIPLLKAAAQAIEWYIQQDPDNIQFNLMALVAGEGVDA